MFMWVQKRDRDRDREKRDRQREGGREGEKERERERERRERESARECVWLCAYLPLGMYVCHVCVAELDATEPSV